MYKIKKTLSNTHYCLTLSRVFAHVKINTSLRTIVPYFHFSYNLCLLTMVYRFKNLYKKTTQKNFLGFKFFFMYTCCIHHLLYMVYQQQLIKRLVLNKNYLLTFYIEKRRLKKKFKLNRKYSDFKQETKIKL